jgi:hypothetical protein
MTHCARAGCSHLGRWHELAADDAPKPPTGSGAQYAPTIYFCEPDDKVRMRALCAAVRAPCTPTHRFLRAARVFFRIAAQLCKRCNSMLYNITKDGNNSQTTELTAEVRARLGGVEYVLSEVDPRVDGAVRAQLVAALAADAAEFLGGPQLASEMKLRPWAPPSDRRVEETGWATSRQVGAAPSVGCFGGELARAGVTACVASSRARCSAMLWRAPRAAIVEPPPPPIPAAAALPPLVRRRRDSSSSGCGGGGGGSSSRRRRSVSGGGVSGVSVPQATAALVPRGCRPRPPPRPRRCRPHCRRCSRRRRRCRCSVLFGRARVCMTAFSQYIFTRLERPRPTSFFSRLSPGP